MKPFRLSGIFPNTGGEYDDPLGFQPLPLRQGENMKPLRISGIFPNTEGEYLGLKEFWFTILNSRTLELSVPTLSSQLSTFNFQLSTLNFKLCVQ